MIIDGFINDKEMNVMAKNGYILMQNGEKIEFELYPNEAPAL